MSERSGNWDGNERRRVDKATGFERHIQTILTTVAAALLIWVGNAMLDLMREQVRTTEQIKHMASKLDQNEAWRQRVEDRLNKLEIGR